jgi:hypothetical protein|tara:strand:- start:171 stop:902 length:732 start_codon:yes stop_codon:yes gene_type:complete
MKDYLKDIVQHTHGLGFIESAKIINEEGTTSLEAMDDDRTVIVQAKFKEQVPGLDGTFGLPNLSKLNVLLNIDEYKENANITVNSQERNGETVPFGLHFENANGDFKNDYRFMSREVVEEKLKSVKFKGVQWDIEIQPNSANIARFKMQSQANSDEVVFVAKTEGADLKFFFGDSSTHAGNFVFETGVENKLTTGWSWPVAQVQSILNLPGDITMKFSDQGAAMITVDSGMATYDYILPAQSK